MIYCCMVFGSSICELCFSQVQAIENMPMKFMLHNKHRHGEFIRYETFVFVRSQLLAIVLDGKHCLWSPVHCLLFI